MAKGYLCSLWLMWCGLQVGYAQEGSTVTNDGWGFHSPVDRSIAKTAQPLQDRFELVDIDTLFYIENRGLTRVLVNLNGYRFKLVVDPREVHQSVNAFLIPHYGEITFNIAAYIHAGEDNFMEVASQGAGGSSADLIIGDLVVPGQEVAFIVEDLVDLPAAFGLLQSYPNPFSDRTIITYEIPDHRTSGVAVFLALYDATGRRVRILVEEQRYPGTFTLEWDGTGDQGQLLANGVYVCRLTAGDVRETILLVYAR